MVRSFDPKELSTAWVTCGGSKPMSERLSIEPLSERLPPDELDLSGIDWVIVGGESGAG